MLLFSQAFCLIFFFDLEVGPQLKELNSNKIEQKNSFFRKLHFERALIWIENDDAAQNYQQLLSVVLAQCDSSLSLLKFFLLLNIIGV